VSDSASVDGAPSLEFIGASSRNIRCEPLEPTAAYATQNG
jgi:hypothetical protein